MDTEYTLEIDFQPESSNPERIFQSMADLITAFQTIDSDLAHCISVKIEPELILLDIEVGSLKAKLRTVINEVDDEAIKKLDWRPAVGKYVLIGKYRLLEWLADKDTIQSRDEIREIQEEIKIAAEETGVLEIPTYQPLQEGALLRDLRLLTDSVASLNPDDEVTFISDLGPLPLNKALRVSQETVEDLLTERTLETEGEMILKVKKPDFLGKSRWEFKHGKRPIYAKIEDEGWLARFRDRTENLLPGDAIRCQVKQRIHYDERGDVIGEHYWIIEVLEIIENVPEIDQDLPFG